MLVGNSVCISLEFDLYISILLYPYHYNRAIGVIGEAWVSGLHSIS